RVPLMLGLSGLAIENIFYAVSVALFIFAGTATLLLTFSLPKGLRYASIAALVVTFLIIPLVYLIVRRQTRFLSSLVGSFRFMSKLKPRAQSLEERIYGFYANTQRSFLL